MGKRERELTDALIAIAYFEAYRLDGYEQVAAEMRKLALDALGPQTEEIVL